MSQQFEIADRSGWTGAACGIAQRALSRDALSPRAALAGSLVAALIVGIYFWRNEGLLANILYAAGITIALAGILMLIGRRIFFASATMALFVWLIATASGIKRATMNMVVHAYDLFFYFSSWSTISFLWNDHKTYLFGLLTAIIGLAVASVLVWRLDASRIARRNAALVILAGAVIGAYGWTAKGERRHMQFNFENLYVSSFYASWGETVAALWHGALIEAAAAPSGSAFALPGACDTAQKPPHIILIHQESVVPPALFDKLAYDKSVDPLFHSQDDRWHKLRVETYGGASWLTEFSILAGVSTHSFGGMRQFVQTFMQNKLKDTLPQVLERCGYRNVVFYPMLKNFVSNDKFYASVGMKEVFDLKAQGAKTSQERDRFYYMNTLAELERHSKSSVKPLFTFVQTMSAHWPYDVTFAPEETVAGGGPGTHPEMHEYLRRVSLAKRDYDHLIAEIKRRLPNERVLVVQYGDHHPMSTRVLLGFNEDTEAEDVALDPNSAGFITYYAINGHNYQVPALPRQDALDVPYLGSVILQSAGLPLSDSHRERMRLLALCKGRYYTCDKRDEILGFHRRLIDSGIMAAR